MSLSTRPARWRAALVGVALAASTLLTACGGDGEQPADDAPASTQQGDDGQDDSQDGDEDDGQGGNEDEDEQDEDEG
ncbi:hypothetical protein O2W14_09295 [Modestobacter sp. VKM Ac-2986]|uniref:hypothetical protein n=1 Tax=Modestobacter sp. VKM Ac-2986 TaxID=3004140 RepID=UPI0022AAD510|nr:hypothetical protein [Modestobacter sp. VKM Ac-2986]MCZ2829026.1 hypothetical protein [Modestobacter sp. VKM Ac-2986]